MYDTRTNNNLTQYPLGETEMNTILEQNESMPGKDTVQEPRTTDASNNVTDSLTTTHHRPSNKTNSVENEYELKETTIETFDSPEKDLATPNHQKDVFYTPAKGLVLGASDTESSLLSGRRAEKLKSSISSTSKEDGGSLKEADLKSLAGETSIASPSIASMKSHSITDGEKSQQGDEGDVSPTIEDEEDEQKEDVEEDKDEKESNDVMEKYMQMILQKKNDDAKNEKQQQQEEQVCE